MFRVKTRTLPQVSVRVPSELKAAFIAYAERLLIDHSTVAYLLVLREKQLQRLAALRKKGRAPKRPRQPRGEAIPRVHITVYFGSLERTEAFEKYAASCGLKPTEALAWLIDREIQEASLERVLLKK